MLPLRVFADGFFDVGHSVVFLQPDVRAFQVASLVDLADRGKPTLSGIVKVWLFLFLCFGPLSFGSIALTLSGPCFDHWYVLLGVRNSS